MNIAIVEFPGLSANPEKKKKIDKLQWQFLMSLEEKLYLLVINISQPIKDSRTIIQDYPLFVKRRTLPGSP